MKLTLKPTTLERLALEIIDEKDNILDSLAEEGIKPDEQITEAIAKKEIIINALFELSERLRADGIHDD